jgi:hypothetical protein
MFKIRRNIYANDKDKILFARSFLDDVSTKDWKRHQKTIDLTAISWFEFIDFLQEHFNLKHLKLLEINAKLKKIRQLNEQLIADLIVYLNNLKMQMSEELLNYQKYFNLMKILNSYLKIAIIRRINVIVFRVELKKIFHLTKKIESISNHIKKIKKSNSFKNIKQYRFQFYSQIDRLDFDASQNAIQNNDRSDDRDKKIIKNATKKIVMINLTTTRIDLKWCVEIAKNAIITAMIVKSHLKTIKIIKMIKTIKTWKKFKISRRNLRRTNSSESRRNR